MANENLNALLASFDDEDDCDDTDPDQTFVTAYGGDG